MLYDVFVESGKQKPMEDASCQTAEGPLCPRCGGKHIIPYVYGLPTYKMVEAEGRGEVAIGGCMPGYGEFFCKSCGAGFQRSGEVMSITVRSSICHPMELERYPELKEAADRILQNALASPKDQNL